MVCVCGTVFCWDDADLTILSGQRKLYCSETCKKRAENARAAERRNQSVCKKRGKVPHPSVTKAQAAAARQLAQNGRVLYPYLCPCGSWHLTKQPPPIPDEYRRWLQVDSLAFRNWLTRIS